MTRPTEQQLQVIEHDEGRAVVFAVAGSGKTTTMAWRVKRLAQQRGVQPSRIVATTFSRFARDQMRSKFDELMISGDVYTLTLHQFASRVITLANKKIDFMPRVQIGDKALQGKTLRDVKNRLLSSDSIQDDSIRSSIKDISEEDFLDLLGKMKGALEFTERGFEQLPEQLREISSRRSFAEGSRWLEILIDAYEEERLERRFRGYDDMLVDALEAVYCSQVMRADISTRFDHIIVDEYQNINKAQDALVRVCDEKRGNLMVIGDDDQTIYEWRGATPAFIRDKIRSQEWKHYFLDLNFRSCAPQVILAAQCISKNRVRAEKKMQPTGDFSGSLELIQCESNEDQAKRLVALIKEKQISGTPLGDQVILIRRYDQSLPIEKELILNKIKYRIPGASFFFDRKEVQFVLSFLLLFRLEQRLIREMRSPTPPERREYRSLLNQVAYRAKTFIRTEPDLGGIGERALDPHSSLSESLQEYAAERDSNRYANALALARFFESAQNEQELQVKDMLAKLESTVDIREKIISASPDTTVGLQRAAIIESLKSFAGSRTLNEVMEEVDELGEYWNNGLKEEDPSHVLRIYTVFKAKGLEFPVVYLPDVHRQAGATGSGGFASSESVEDEISAGPEEERRIFYVAITRSVRDLYMFHWQEPSQYLTEASFEKIQEYQALANAFLSNQERDSLDARQIGRIFSAYSYKYEAKQLFANIFSRMNPDEEAQALQSIHSSVEYLKDEPGAAIREKLGYEKLQRFWSDAKEIAARIRNLPCDSEDNTACESKSLDGHMPTTAIDPFDEVFGDD
jgi:DNA helicase-2/ATP-dependent DNA helicase PcrA